MVRAGRVARAACWHRALEEIAAHWTHLFLEGASPLRSPSLLALRIDQWRRPFRPCGDH
jgi:hypothetical protein